MATKLGSTRGRKCGFDAVLLIAASPCALMSGTAFAQSASAPSQMAEIEFNIPPQPLVDAMRAFSQATGIQAIYATSIGSGVASPGVKGRLSAPVALSQLLSGSGLTYRFTGPQSVALEPAPRAEGAEIQLRPVRVEGSGVAAPTNEILTPKTDRAATDRSHSYAARAATVAGKTAQSLREIPQSVTVVTRQQLDDSNATSIARALLPAPGVTVYNTIATAGNGANLLIRGYTAELEYDGIPIGGGSAAFDQFDMAMYDRIEILKGPSGLEQGAGDPSGTVNLVRKRPHETFGWAGSIMGGSWNNFHGDLDVTGPLNARGSIRGRVVVAGQDRDAFVNKVHERHGLIYGILEFDLDPQTTLTVSGTIQGQKEGPIDFGLTPNANGQIVRVPRSAFFGVDWSHSTKPSREGYASLQHDLGGGWKFQVSALYKSTKYDALYGYIFGNINNDFSVPDYSIQAQLENRKFFSVDSFVSGPFRAFGREHQITVGANYTTREFRQKIGFDDRALPDVFNIAVPEHNVPFFIGSDQRIQQVAAYGQARLSIADPLTIVLGGRVTNYRSKSRSTEPVVNPYTTDAGKTDAHLTPYAAALLDVTKHITLYGSYTTIFSPQNALSFGGGALRPRTGEQFEAGIKGAFFGDALNASAALFNITDRNRAFADPDHPNFFVPLGKVRSRGVELELSGEPLPGWSITAGYTYLETKFLRDATQQGGIFNTDEPKHLFKLWTTYLFGEPQEPGLEIGGGIRAQSRTGATSTTTATSITQPSYAVVDAQIGYRLAGGWSASVTLNNIFDKRYLIAIPRQLGGLYGEPRSFTVALRKSF